MSNRLQGKTAFVTAAGQGIGRATAARLRARGRERDRDRHRRGRSWRRWPARPASRPRARRARRRRRSPRCAPQPGAVDVLFNCAGFVHHGTILDCTEEDWDFAFDLNVRVDVPHDPRLPARHAGSAAAARSSTWPRSPRRMKGAPNRFVYGATKAAVIGLTKSVATDYVTAGHPLQRHLPRHGGDALAATSASRRSAAPAGAIEAARAAFIARQPMGRLGTRRGDRGAGRLPRLATKRASSPAPGRSSSTAAGAL